MFYNHRHVNIHKSSLLLFVVVVFNTFYLLIQHELKLLMLSILYTSFTVGILTTSFQAYIYAIFAEVSLFTDSGILANCASIL